MGYQRQREDGNLVRKFKVDGHNKAACDAELWYYGFVSMDNGVSLRADDEDCIVWYKHEGKWHILLAGPEAYRQYAE